MLWIYAIKRDIVGIAMSSFLLILLPMSLRAVLTRCSVAVNDAGISAVIFGVATKRIRWSDVTKVRKMRVYISMAFVDGFVVFENHHGLICRFFVNICGSVGFSESINECRELLDLINQYAQLHDIPLTVIDVEKMRNDLARDTKPGRWRRGMKRDAEVRVTEF